MPKIDRKEIEKKIKEILARELGIKIENITPEKRLVEDLGMDSFAAIELMFELEDELSIEIADKELVKIKTVSDIVSYITNRLEIN